MRGPFIIEFRAEFSSIEGTINNHELTLFSSTHLHLAQKVRLHAIVVVDYLFLVVIAALLQLVMLLPLMLKLSAVVVVGVVLLVVLLVLVALVVLVVLVVLIGVRFVCVCVCMCVCVLVCVCVAVAFAVHLFMFVQECPDRNPARMATTPGCCLALTSAK